MKDNLILLANTVYPALQGADVFTITLEIKENSKAHGDYTPSKRHINIYNSMNKSREHLVATAIHELAHHIECLERGTSGHSKNFYKILHELLCYALGLEELCFDYDEAKSRKMLDSNDIRMVEKHFGRPILMSKDMR